MLGEALREEMTRQGIELRPDSSPLALSRDATGRLTIEHSGGPALTGYDVVLWAIGRGPNTAGLGLESVGLVPDAGGHIPVDELQNTKVPGIYSVGDVTGRF